MEDNIKLDSDEELYFLHFLEELKNAGYIKDFKMQPEPFKLFDAVTFNWNKPKPTKKEPNRIEKKESTFMEGKIYTPDSYIIWDERALGIFHTPHLPTHYRDHKFISHYDFNIEEYISYVEVKPHFDQNNMTREFKINQKWVYQKFDIYVNLFIHNEGFPKFFTPTWCILNMVYKKTTKTKKYTKYPGDSKITWKVRTLIDYIEIMKRETNLLR